MRRHVVVLLALVAAALVVAAPAGAVTIGSATPVSETVVLGPKTFVQTVDPTGGPTYAVPAGGGVLTGWKARTEAAGVASGTFKFKVVRPAAGGQFTLVGETAVTVFGTGGFAFVDTTAAARISVQAGDRLAVFVPAGGDVAAASSPAAGSEVRSTAADASGTFAVMSPAPVQLKLEATVEPDADGDGFGDLTQDGCPGLAALQAAPCSTDLSVSIAATPPSITAGGASALVASFSAAGDGATGATGTFTVPAGLDVLSATTAAGECNGSGTLTCPLGNLPSGATRKAFLVVRSAAPGTFTVAAAAQSINPDTAPLNNTASAILQVTAVPVAKLCTVPSLRGASLATARSRLNKAGCAVGRRSGRGGSRARVRAQGIPAGVRVAIGTKVPLSLALPRKR